MKILFTCICGQLLATSSVISGFKITCPKCQIRITVPFENSANSAVSEIIEIDYKDVLDPNGELRSAVAIAIPTGNNLKQYGCSYDQWDKFDPISNRELP